VTRRMKVRLRGFHKKWREAFTFSVVSLTAEFERGPLDRGDETRVGWFTTLRCYISETVRDTA